MDKPKIPVQISTVKDAEGQEHRIPTVPLSEVLYGASSSSYKDELAAFGKLYEELVESCKEILTVIQMEKKILKRVNPLLLWALGDRINSFLNKSQKSPFYLAGLYSHLSRELSLSGSSLEKIVAFRRKFNKSLDVDANKSWKYYRDLSGKP